MDKNTLLVKTDKGRDAMARRVPELGPRLRSMLIMVDGKRSLSELDKLGAGLGGGAALLEQLLDHGWIAPSLSDLLGSGMINSGSTSIRVPRPEHVGQAPNGELNENDRGSSSSNESPSSRHARCSL